MNKHFFSLFLVLTLFLSALSPSVYATEETEAASAPTEMTETVPPDNGTSPTDGENAGKNTGGSNSGLDAVSALTEPSDIDFDAQAILLYEMNSGTMVYAKNIDEKRYPASLTKVMTCLLALEHGTLTDVITVSDEVVENLDPNGSSSGLMAGEELTLEQLLFCLMIESANDAAPVIAQYIAGDESSFIQMMNDKAKELGCTNTHFMNTHGLHDENHYTTARDLSKIMTAALEYDKFREIYSTDRYVMPATNLHDERILVTTNFLIGTTLTSQYYDSRVVGGKTGFTTPAGRCIMCTAEKDNLNYLCVVLGAENISTEEGTVYGSFVVASKVLDLGFNDFTFAEVLSPLAPIAQLSVKDATQSVVLVPQETVTTMLPKEYDPALLTTNYELNSPDGLQAPLEAGQEVGVVREYYGDICVGETKLLTMTGVQKEAFAAAATETVEEIKDSPWRIVIWVSAGVLLLLVALMFWSAWVRYQNKKRREQRRRR